MALRLAWSDERYVRVYVRDTLDWAALSWDAQALWCQLNRKATRTGRIDLGRVGRRGVAALLGRAELAERIDAALGELLEDGCVRLDGSALVIPDFVEAQEAVASGGKRMRELRERRREDVTEPAASVTEASVTRTSRGQAAGASDETSPRARAADVPGADRGAARPQQAPEDPGGGDETSRNVTRGYSTARKVQHGTDSTVEHGAPADVPPTSRPLPAREAAGNEAGDLGPLQGRVLLTLDGWRTVADLAAALRRSPGRVEEDLRALRRECLVESAERGSPPVMHWRRISVAGEAAAAGGRS
jgi:hypothetical protein